MEGLHCCEATCRTLQGYQLGDSVPLKYAGVEAPPTSTIFQKISTQVYYCKDEIKLDETVLANLREVSKNIADMKTKIVHVTWHDCSTRVLDEIIEDKHLADLMYKNQEEFYKEDVHYKAISFEDICSNQIKNIYIKF